MAVTHLQELVVVLLPKGVHGRQMGGGDGNRGAARYGMSAHLRLCCFMAVAWVAARWIHRMK